MTSMYVDSCKSYTDLGDVNAIVQMTPYRDVPYKGRFNSLDRLFGLC
jgi:hypothetical protein